MTNEQVKSLEVFQRHPLGLASCDRAPPPSVRWWQVAKQAMLALLLAVAFLCHYLLDTFVAGLSPL